MKNLSLGVIDESQRTLCNTLLVGFVPHAGHKQGILLLAVYA